MIKQLTSITFLTLSLAAALPATPVILDLGGGTQFDGWSNLNNLDSPGYGPTFWPGPITANEGQASATLNRVSPGTGVTGPYPASSSMYFLGAGTLSITDSAPVANLNTVVLQLQSGDADDLTFSTGGFPVLTYNNGTSFGSATYSGISSSFSVPFTPPEGPPTELTTNTWYFQWDLSSLGTIDNFQIQWAQVTHTQLYDITLDQSSAVWDTAAIPEPGSALLLALTVGGLAVLRRRRK